MIILNENKQTIDCSKFEAVEQSLAKKYIQPNDVVLELGARYGSVSCTINSILHNPNNHVAVEPDERVWECLELNKINNNADFFIVKGCISKTKMSIRYDDREWRYQKYGTYCETDSLGEIPTYSLSEIKKTANINEFNVLIADCEGCLPLFILENMDILASLRLIIFEQDRDGVVDYNETKNLLTKHYFDQKEFIKPHHFVYIKSFNSN